MAGVYKEARTPASKGKQLRDLILRKSSNGGVLATHHYHDDGMTFHHPKEHVFGADEHNEVLSHVIKHLGLNVSGRGSDEPEEEENEG